MTLQSNRKIVISNELAFLFNFIRSEFFFCNDIIFRLVCNTSNDINHSIDIAYKSVDQKIR